MVKKTDIVWTRTFANNFVKVKIRYTDGVYRFYLNNFVGQHSYNTQASAIEASLRATRNVIAQCEQELTKFERGF